MVKKLSFSMENPCKDFWINFEAYSTEEVNSTEETDSTKSSGKNLPKHVKRMRHYD